MYVHHVVACVHGATLVKHGYRIIKNRKLFFIIHRLTIILLSDSDFTTISIKYNSTPPLTCFPIRIVLCLLP